MRLNVPISVGSGWGRFFTRWDVLAVLLILGLLVFLAEASRHLLAAAVRVAARRRYRSIREICRNTPRAPRCAC